MYYSSPDGVSVHSGFPNPAADASLQALDFNQLLIHNAASTFAMRITGHQWQDIGIFDHDIAIVDRALAPKGTDLVVWVKDDGFVVSPKTQLPEGAEVWGVLTATIHQFRQKTVH